jgi:hypothetical protein
MKIYVAAVQSLRKTERGGQNRMKTQFTMVFFSVPAHPPPLPPAPLMLMYFFGLAYQGKDIMFRSL